MDYNEAIGLLQGGQSGVLRWNVRRTKGEAVPGLGGANLSRAELGGADLRGVDLLRTDLSGANLTGAMLDGADLRDGNLRDADFTDACLRDADLRGATVSGAKFERAVLAGADLTYQRHLTQAQVDTACGASDTRLPGTLTSPPKWR